MACGLLFAACSGAVPAADAASVSGPHTVKPGSVVTFHGDGFAPNQVVGTNLFPVGRCGMQCHASLGGSRRFRTDSDGSVRVRFRFPRHYTDCLVGPPCKSKRWKAGHFADLLVETNDGELIQIYTRLQIAGHHGG